MRCPTTLLIAVAMAAGAAHAQPPMFGTSHEETSPMYRYAIDYLQQLCRDSGLQCRLQSLPGRRAEAMLANGDINGEVGRVKAYADKHPDYIRIDGPYILTHVRFFTQTRSDEITSWEALAKKTWSVSYKRGIYIYQRRLEALRPNIKPHDVQNEAACLRMVLAGRDDACIFDDGGLSGELQSLLTQGHAGPPVEELPLYIYLDKKNAAQAPALNESARHLAARGVPAQLRRKYIEAVK